MTNQPIAETDRETPALSEAEVENLLSTLSKALRAFNMYQANNPVFQRFQATLGDAFAAVWASVDRLELGVQEEGFRWGGRTFGVGKGRESLSFAFYKDGVRTLVFLPGFEDEVGAFLKAVTRAMRHEEGEDDLITVLWEEDFESLQYGYVDLLAEGVSIPEEPQMEQPLSLDGGALKAEVAEDEEAAEGETEGAGALSPAGLSREDFDETLYFLDHTEMAALQTEVEVEMERDLRRDVLNALFDRLEDAGAKRQGEIMDILDQLLPLFLSRGDLTNATRILEELGRIAGGDGVDASLRERMDRLFQRLSNPEVLQQFVQALEDGAVSPQADEVNLFFSRLSPEAMPVLIRFAEMSETPGVRGRLSSAIDGLAQRHPNEVAKLLQSEETAVVLGAARVAGRTALAAAVPALHATMKHRESVVRLAVVEALVAIRSTPALHALMDTLDDPDRDVRITAAKALAAVRFASARDRLAKVIDGKQLKDADLTEKMAFFEAYGAVGGAAAVERLDVILNHKGLLGRRNPSELRACAALGLALAGTPAARASLEKARDEDDSIVRNAVLRALREEVEPL